MIQQFHCWVFTEKKKKKTPTRKDIWTPMFIATLFTIANIQAT